MKIREHEIPDKCPSDCISAKTAKEYIDSITRGGLCCRCPITNCSKIDDSIESLIEPNDYREDWLLQYIEMWKNGNIPELKIEQEKTCL